MDENAAPIRWNKHDDEMLETALWHLSNSISLGKSSLVRCDTTEWVISMKKRLMGDTSPIRMREVLQLILDKHVGRDAAGNKLALFGEDVISLIKEALNDTGANAKEKGAGNV